MRFALVISLLVVGQIAGQQDATQPELDILKFTNIEREKVNLPALKLSSGLSKVARAHSGNMAKQDKLVHDLDGKSAFDRIKESGYVYQRAGENVGLIPQQFPIEKLIEAWMNSPGHKANILLPDYTELGVGIARNENGMLYCTQVFAKPR